MRVLVTGGGGFLGSAICRRLLREGYQPVAFQRGAASHLDTPGIRIARGDICDQTALAEAAQGCGAVIHAAAKAGLWGAAAEYQRVNVDGTDTVIRVCRDLAIGALVFTSSPSIVHRGKDIEGGDESLPLADHFLAPYPATKARAESMVLAANGPRLRTNALRPHLIWGPGDPHILPRLAQRVRGGRLLLPGANKRVDTIFVENAALAHLRALQELLAAGRSAGKPYFVSNDEPLPQGEIVGRLLAAAGIEARIQAVPAIAARFAGALCETTWRLFGLAAEPPVTRFSADQLCTAHWYDMSAAKRDLGYRPEVSISEGLSRINRQLTEGSQQHRAGRN
jgi:nucleoside-diphosphate-sugar epimerase